MQVITLVNEKGGVGKTTLAVHLAAGLAARGLRVMVMDADPQAHSTIRLGVAKAPKFYDLLVRHDSFSNCAVGIKPERFGFVGETLPTGKLWVVPGNIETRTVNDNMDDMWTIWTRLQELKGAVDVVIFDTSPTPSLLHGSIYLASDGLLIPTKLTHNSFDGLVGTMQRLERGSKIRQQMGMSNLRIMGIVPIAYEKNTIEHNRNLEALQKQYSETVWNPVTKRIIWQETESRALPVWALEPSSPAAADAFEIIDQMEGQLNVTA